MMSKEKTSIHLSYLLRHAPEAAELDMDRHGWVSVSQLIANEILLGRRILRKNCCRKLLRQITRADIVSAQMESG